MLYCKIKGSFVVYCLVFMLIVGCSQAPKENFRDIVNACKERNQQEVVICRGLNWIFEHPVDIEQDGFLELGEEINLFYKFYVAADNEKEKDFFKSIIKSKIDYLLNEHDFEIEFAGEITAYLTFAKIMRRVNIEKTKYLNFIEDEVLSNPMTYPPSITYSILNSAIIEDIGYEPKVSFGTMVNEGIIAHFSRNPKLVPIGKAYASPNDVQNFFYDITHEIFAVSNFGDRDPTQFLLEDELQFLKDLIPKGISIYIDDGQVDILGELIICAKLLNYTDFHNYEVGLQYILDAQKEDGSFGLIDRMAFLGRPNLYRHGVLVSLWALME
jgi:hypothetical protein